MVGEACATVPGFPPGCMPLQMNSMDPCLFVECQEWMVESKGPGIQSTAAAEEDSQVHTSQFSLGF